MCRLVIDIETYSSEDLGAVGAYKYAEAPDFEILLIGYARDDEPVRVLDLTGDYDRAEYAALTAALTDPAVAKIAHNNSFERVCLARWTGLALPPEQWEDTMHMAQRCGLPASLDNVGRVLHLEEQKADTGKALIRYFCKPVKPTEANGGRTRNLPLHAPEKWAVFVDYCRQDVETERALYRRLRPSDKPTETERAVELLDAKINARGIPIDRAFAVRAAEMDAACKREKLAEMQRITGLQNPMSAPQLKLWLAACGVATASLDKAAVADLLDTVQSPTVRRVLALRQQLSKTSTTKYPAVLAALCSDDRIRGTLQYYGAGRTGRWAGRILQPQNLPQNHLDRIEDYRAIVGDGDLDGLSLLEDVPDTLSQLIRAMIRAGEGKTLLVADYHAIEAVCIAYLAGERWRLSVFAGDGKIYEASYAQAFGVPKESVVKGSPQRQKGKIMELACGYGGGVGALKKFGADKMGLADAGMRELIRSWRRASPAVVRFWHEAEDAARRAIRAPGHTIPLRRRQDGYLVVIYRADADGLWCKLPSGRKLCYSGAFLDGGEIRYHTQEQQTRKWVVGKTYGGKLVENIVQAFARDILAEAMLRLDAAGYEILFSVHDEIICEAPKTARWEDMAAIMGEPVAWAPGLDRYLHADGYSTVFYKKD